MILTCPDCETRFVIKAEAIGLNGRTVRCSNCTATWFVAHEPDVLDLEDNQQSTQNPETVERELVHPEYEHDDYAVDENPLEGYLDANDPDTHESKAKPEDYAAPHALLRDKADRKRARANLISVIMVWLTVLALISIAIIFSLMFRAQIVSKIPAMAHVYNAFSVEASDVGLEFHNVEAKFGVNDGVRVLFVNGSIRNYDRRNRVVGLIKINFKNKSGEVFDSWVIEPGQAVLKGGDTMEFISQLPNPPIEAVSVFATFADE